jgi:hypothetical protein
MTKPIATFFRLATDAPAPINADPTVEGTLPLRAVQHCEPVLAASGYGWQFFSPTDFDLIFDGRSFLCSYDAGKTWSPLADSQIPDLEKSHRSCTPEKVANLLPPFLSALPESGVVQIWTGYFARTRNNWALSIGGLSNRFRTSVYDCMEGIVETDWWTGPLFTNLIFRQANRPVKFSRAAPLFQVRPVFKPAYSSKLRKTAQVILDSSSIASSDWDEYAWSATRNEKFQSEQGWYSKCVRKARRS